MPNLLQSSYEIRGKVDGSVSLAIVPMGLAIEWVLSVDGDGDDKSEDVLEPVSLSFELWDVDRVRYWVSPMDMFNPEKQTSRALARSSAQTLALSLKNGLSGETTAPRGNLRLCNKDSVLLTGWSEVRGCEHMLLDVTTVKDGQDFSEVNWFEDILIGKVIIGYSKII